MSDPDSPDGRVALVTGAGSERASYVCEASVVVDGGNTIQEVKARCPSM